jgi:DNA-binding response OmpR family regulator
MNSKKILIVDDDRHLVVALTVRLKATGYEVVSAADAVSAIAVARKERPDLIILDLGLPAGDGFLVLERIKSLDELMNIPVIVLSARDPTGNKKRSLEAGGITFFQKPPNNHEFLAAIRQTLGETTGLATFLTT